MVPQFRRRSIRARSGRKRSAATCIWLVACVAACDCGSTTNPDSTVDEGNSTLDASIVDDDDQFTIAEVGDEDDVSSLTFKASRVFCCDPLEYEFIAELTGSDDASAAVFTWRFGDGRTRTGLHVRHTYAFAGEYEVSLSVSHPDGREAVVQRKLRAGIQDPVVPEGSQTVPVAVAGDDQVAEPGVVVVLDGTGSHGETGDSLTYTWTQLSGIPVELTGAIEPIAAFVAPDVEGEAEVLSFSLVVTANDVAASEQATVNVIVGLDGEPDEPEVVVVAEAGPDSQVEARHFFTLDGTNSTGSGTEPLSFSWAQVTGPTVEFTHPTNNRPTNATTALYAPKVSEGPYTLVFDLTVRQGESHDTDRVTVEVLPGPPDPPPPDEQQVLAWLSELRPLQKVHHCWPVERDQLVARDPRLAEYVRITGSVGIRGEWWGASYDGNDEIRAAVEMCQAHGATIAINYSPWHRVVEHTDHADPRVTGPKYEQEIDLYRTSLEMIKERLAGANAELGADVRITVLLLDTEIYVVKPDDEPAAEEWNAAIDAKLNPFYIIGKEVFPDSAVEWYDRGTTLGRWKRFTGRELGDGYSTSLYAMSALEQTRNHFRWSVNRSPDGEMRPWVALGGGWFWHGDQRTPWRRDRPYDLRVSWQLGAEINIPYYGDRPDEYAPWHAAKTVTFFPGPFHPSYPLWAEHFVAYVRGANGVDELPR